MARQQIDELARFKLGRSRRSIPRRHRLGIRFLSNFAFGESELTSRLTGTHREELVFEIGFPEASPSEPDFVIWDLSVTCNMPNCFPSLSQNVRSRFYGLPDLEPLEKLLGGDSSARFEIDVLNFHFEIFEHTLNNGPRYGYVVKCYVYSNNTTQISDWEDIADQLLRERWDGALSLEFAFLVGHESLNSFYREFAADLRDRAHIVG